MSRTSPLRRFPTALLAPALVATAAAATTPGFPLPAALAVVLAAAIRVLFLHHGREIVAPRAWMLFWASAPAIATAYASAVQRVGGQAGPALLAVGAVAVAAGLLAPSTPTSWARLLGLAGLLVAGACLAAPERLAVLGGLAFVVLLIPAALAFGEAPPRASGAGAEGLVRRVHAPSAAATPWQSNVRVVLLLLLLGLPVGVMLFRALPRNPSHAERRRAAEAARAARDARDLDRLDPSARGIAAPLDKDERDWMTGPAASNRSDFHKTLRPTDAVVLTVRVGDGERGPEPLWLRGTTYDQFDGRSWTRSTASDAAHLATEDPTRPGWKTLAPSADPAAATVWRLRVVDIDARAARTALWLLPGATRIHLDGRSGGLGVLASADGNVHVTPPGAWLPMDAYETAGPVVGLDRTGLAALASDSRTAPLPSTVVAPPDARVYRDEATRVVGGATSPAERAARIEAYLRSPPFVHDMVELTLDPRRPVTDFLLRARCGHCWCFASAMTLMMRSLGHPARFATGLRGGEFRAVSGSYDFRGRDAHAWCEVAYEGRGWVIYDPTRPSVEARDTGDAGEGAEAAAERDDGARSFWDDLFGVIADDRPGALDRMTDAVRRTMRAIFSSVAGLLAAVLGLALVAGLVVALVRIRRAAKRPLAPVASTPKGPYARALCALAGGGVSRRSTETPVEFGSRAVGVVPAASGALSLLTSDHDEERYGGRTPDDAARARDEAAADRVVDAVRERRTRSDENGATRAT